MGRAVLCWGPLLALLLAGAPAAAANAVQEGAMQAAANAFYAVYGSLPRQGGLPNATARMRYAKVLSPRLNRMLNQAQAAQVRFDRKVKGAAPPLIEGEMFSSLFEGPTSWTVGTCTGDTNSARCPVAMVYLAPGQPPVKWTDTLALVHSDAGWKVDDILYDPRLRGGNTGKLSSLLGMALAEDNGKLKRGDRAAAVVGASGFSCGATAFVY